MTETKSALIIANYRYDHPDLRQLVAPAQDAESLARVLADPASGGFEVRTLINEPSHQVSLEIESFCDNRKRDDLLLLYFSGHGIKDSDGHLYFATIDTQLVQHNVRRATAVSASFVNEVMSRSRSRRQILLLDCCYSGAFKQGMLAKGDRRVGAGEQFDGKGRIVLTASDALQYSFEGEHIEGEGARSIFTRTLVRGLETGEADLDRDGFFSLDEVYDYVYGRVSDEQPEQKPTKMGYVEGRIFIGSNPHPLAAKLPPELQRSIEDPLHWVRLGAVQELEALLLGKHPGLALAAQTSLASLAKKDFDLRVRSAAAKCLDSLAAVPVSGNEVVPGPVAGRAGRPREQGFANERQVLEAERVEAKNLDATEHEGLAREQAEAALQKAEAQRAQEKTEAQERFEAPVESSEEAEGERREAEAERAQEETEARKEAEEARNQLGVKRVGEEAETQSVEADPAQQKAEIKQWQNKSEARGEERRRKARIILIPASTVVLLIAIYYGFFWRKSPEWLLTLSGHGEPVMSVAWSPDGKRLATGSGDNAARVWDAETGEDLLTLSGTGKPVSSVAWSPDGKRLATGSYDMGAKVWDAETGKELLTLNSHSPVVHSVAWSPDGKRLATGGQDATARVWDAETGAELLTLSSHKVVVSVAWSPDGMRLATGSLEAMVWDAETGKEMLTLRGHNRTVNGVAWSPDGTRLATGSSDGTAKVWDAATGKELLTLDSHSSVVHSVAWSLDGKRLAMGSGDNKAKVWDAETGKELLTLRGHNNSVDCVAWRPDGKRLATASFDKTAMVWEVGR